MKQRQRKANGKSRPVTRRVRQAYSQRDLQRVCTLREDRFGRAFGMQTTDVGGGEYYHFRDNGSSVLAVAHLDTVVPADKRTARFYTTQHGPMVVSGALDDRLGAYVILCLLPALGITCDVLLTIGEEHGASTAEWFKAEKDYDWIIEFDRAGTDVVMYQYEDADSIAAVEAAGAFVGMGSFSDIASMEHLGVKAFNWGVGYDGNYHSTGGYAYLNDTFAMVAKYARFHQQNAGRLMTHDASAYPYGYGLGRWCDTCAEGKYDPYTCYCDRCGACQDCGGARPGTLQQDPDVAGTGLECDCYMPATRPGDHAITWDEWLATRPAEPAGGVTWTVEPAAIEGAA